MAQSKSYQITLKQILLSCLFISLLTVLHGKGRCEVPGEEASYYHAQSLWSQSRWEEAVLAFEDYLSEHHNGEHAAQAYIYLGEYLESFDRLEEALDIYQGGLEQAEGRMAEVLQTEIAAVHNRMGNFDQAMEIYQRVMRETKEWDLFKAANNGLKDTFFLRAEKKRYGKIDDNCGKESLKVAFNLLGIAPKEDVFKNNFKDLDARSSLKALKKVASAHGIDSFGIMVKSRSLENITPPAILHFHPGHYVVFQGMEKNGVKIFDPTSQPEKVRVLTYDQLKNMWTGYGLCFNQKVKSIKDVALLNTKEMMNIWGGHHPTGTRPDNKGGNEDNLNTEYDNQLSVCDPLYMWVNTSSLNLVIENVDDIWRGIGINVVLKRTYNSDDSTSGMFGNGWHFEYEVSLVENPNNTVSLKRGSGKVDVFTSKGDGTYTPPVGVFDQLKKNTDGTYTLLIKRTKETYYFNTNRNLSAIVDKNGNRADLTWGENGITKIAVYCADSSKKEITFEYETGLCTKINLPDGRSVTFAYDSNGNLSSRTDMAGYQTTFHYDAKNYIDSVTTPSGTTQVIYQQDSVNANLYIPKTIIDPLGNQSNFSIDVNALVVTITDSNSHSRKYAATGITGFTGSITNADGSVISYAYDNYGNRTSITDPKGNKWLMSYDPSRSNVTKITDPLGNAVSMTYDSNDNLLSITAPLDRHAEYQYDSNSNLIKVIDSLSNQVILTYDTQGKLISIGLPGGGSYTFTYDSCGSLLSQIDPGGYTTHFSYDSSGRVISRTDANGNIIRFDYDELSRVTKASYPDGNVTYEYDCCSLGKVRAKDGREMNYQHDANNHLTRYQDLNGFVIQYSYDGVGNLTSITYPGNKVVNYEYDRTNRLIEVKDWLNNPTTYEYDAAGNLIRTTYPSGSIILQQYDDANGLKSILDYNADATVNAILDYTLDALGNRAAISSYQPLNAIPSWQNVSYSYNPDNRLLSTGNTNFNYDNNGNLTKKTAGSSVTNYSWDFNNMLTQVVAGGKTYSFKYDAIGNRNGKVENSVETKYVVDPNTALSRILAETDSNGTITAYYVYGLGLISKIVPSGQTYQAYYYHSDGIGSTIAMTDSSGTIVNKYAYDAFGKVMNQAETINNPFKYVGRFGVMDEGNGLLYMRARYYDLEVGRFINKDPIGLFGGYNLYTYVANNPINLIDPLGFQSHDPIQCYRSFRRTVRTIVFIGGFISGYLLSSWSDLGMGWSIGIGIASGAGANWVADMILDSLIDREMEYIRDWSEEPLLKK
ncbi:MAG: cysteine peptidase family C39 domain-containing protein [Proteobacteria bacterium]|nr:cysteine peptidase family C39 domain-containing protein [Pseudomonadota bacterium]